MAFEFDNRESAEFIAALKSGVGRACHFRERIVSVDMNPWSQGGDAGGSGGSTPGTGWPGGSGEEANQHIAALTEAVQSLGNQIFTLSKAPSKAMAEMTANRMRSEMDLVEGLLTEHLESLDEDE